MTDEALAKIAVFQRQEVRKQLHNGEWWFVINDVIAALTDSTDPARYLRNLRARAFGFSEGDFIWEEPPDSVPPGMGGFCLYRDWETDRKSTRLNSSHSAKSRMPSSA